MSSTSLMGSLSEGTTLARGGGGQGGRARKGNKGQEITRTEKKELDESEMRMDQKRSVRKVTSALLPPAVLHVPHSLPPTSQVFQSVCRAYVRPDTHSGAGRPPGWRRQRGQEVTPKCCCSCFLHSLSNLGSPQYNWSTFLFKIYWRTRTAQKDGFMTPTETARLRCPLVVGCGTAMVPHPAGSKAKASPSHSALYRAKGLNRNIGLGHNRGPSCWPAGP